MVTGQKLFGHNKISMVLSDERIQELKEVIEKDSGKGITWEDAVQASHALEGLARLALESAIEDQRRKKKLEESPKGFTLDGAGYTCHVCGMGTPAGGNWYDKWGIKCLICQKAVDKKIIPGSVAKNKDGWYSKYDLESRFNIKHHALKKFIAKGILKPRIVPDEDGKPHAYLFLLKDHKDILPPKKLTESRMVKEEKDGKEWFHSEPWYRFGNPHEVAKGYRIMEYMHVIPPEEMKAREEAEKKKREEKLARRMQSKRK